MHKNKEIAKLMALHATNCTREELFSLAAINIKQSLFVSKSIGFFRRRKGRIHFIIDDPRSEALKPEEGDVAWVENEKGNYFGIRIDVILPDGSPTGTVAQIRPSSRQEVNGIHRKDKVYFHMDFIWQVVRPK